MVVLSEVCRRGDPLQRSQNHSANDFTGARLFAFRMRGHSHRFVRLSEVPNTTYNINSQVDLKPDNILVKIEDPAILDRDARDEYVNPLPQKVTDKGIIYLSRNDYGQFSKPTGIIQITDFGSSVSGKTPHSGCIQAEAYRAPEVILDAGCSYSADIWSLGVMVRPPMSMLTGASTPLVRQHFRSGISLRETVTRFD